MGGAGRVDEGDFGHGAFLPKPGGADKSRQNALSCEDGNEGWGGAALEKFLDGRVAVITGSNRNIGRTIALQMAAAGASIVVNGHRDKPAIDDVVSEIRKSGGKAIGAVADVSSRDDVRRMVAAGAEAFGKVDIAVSNVAIRKPSAFLDVTPEDWDFTLRTNLSAAFHLAQATLPHMIGQKWGRIIHIVGGSNFFAYSTLRVHSAAARAGVHGLNSGLAREFGESGVTVNTVAPGMIDTVRDMANYRHIDMDKTLQDIPLGRRGRQEEIAATCVFLTGPGGAYITGQVIHVNGGHHVT